MQAKKQSTERLTQDMYLVSHKARIQTQSPCSQPVCYVWLGCVMSVDSARNLNPSWPVGLGRGRFIVLPREITGDVEMFKGNVVQGTTEFIREGWLIV